MNLYHNSPFALLLISAMGLLSTAVQAQSQATDLQLKYQNNTETCIFHTDHGVKVSGSVPGTVEAEGEFGAGCNVGGGSNPGPTSVSVVTDHTTRDPGETATIVWNANADVCKFDGSVLPEQVLPWKTNGYACTEAGSCAAGSLTHTFTTPGVYTFKLTCDKGLTDTQSATATVTVGDPTPPVGTCDAPVGLTRDVNGTIANSSGWNSETVNVQQWQNVYGHRVGGPNKAWPGYYNRDVNVTISKNHFWALEFKVGSGYPYYGSWNGGVGPWGTWASTASNTTTGVKWTLSISPTCGDFPTTAELAAMPTHKRACYSQYVAETNSALLWLVAAGSQNPVSYMCTLRRNQTYYLNILPAPLGDPLNITNQGCNQAACKGNFASKGNFDGSQGL